MDFRTYGDEELVRFCQTEQGNLEAEGELVMRVVRGDFISASEHQDEVDDEHQKEIEALEAACQKAEEEATELQTKLADAEQIIESIFALVLPYDPDSREKAEPPEPAPSSPPIKINQKPRSSRKPKLQSVPA